MYILIYQCILYFCSMILDRIYVSFIYLNFYVLFNLQCAIHHAGTRSAFGKLLIDQPLMENLLADLCVEADASTTMAMYMASAFDLYESGTATEAEKELFRIGVTVTKYYVTKRLPQFVYECMEVFGGNGFAEDHPMAKMFRHSPLNSIWEGSGNVIALDILRASKSIPILLKDINTVKGREPELDNYIKNLTNDLATLATNPSDAQRSARNFADRLAVAFQASILLRFGDPDVASAYIQSRVKNSHGGHNYGSVVYSAALAKSIVRNNLPVFC
jgi:putative acyl-CoA dehydrogenase